VNGEKRKAWDEVVKADVKKRARGGLKISKSILKRGGAVVTKEKGMSIGKRIKVSRSGTVKHKQWRTRGHGERRSLRKKRSRHKKR